jgi:serine/threonine-protein kinase
MGSVYLARDMQGGDNYAVKILRDDLVLEPGVRERFLNEARAAKRISHPAVAATYDVGEMSTGSIFIVMEFVNGPPLRRLLRNGAVSQGRVTLICAAIAEGLAEAHRQGVVHRDLKPENILLPRFPRPGGGPDSVVKVVDFGIARMIDAPGITTTHHVMGTPQYISPEQAMGGPVDGRTDIYSLGVLMYEMLTGALPFHDTDPERLLRKHIKARPTPISELDGPISVDPRLERLVMSCLEKSPRHRPDGMEEVITALASLDGPR